MQVDTILVPLNVIVYASVAVGLLQGRRRSAAAMRAGDHTTFGQLESALRERFPDMPEGFTMREGLSRARSFEPGLGWDRIEKSLERYEAYRYGSDAPPSVEQPELAKLIRKLRSPW